MQRAAPQRRRLSIIGLLAAVGGAALVVVAVRQAGPDEILAGIRRLGTGFVAVLAVAALRDVIRTLAWQTALEGDARLGLLHGWGGRLAGEALGNLTPFGVLVSEPTKAAFVRDRVPFQAALAGTVVENLYYSLSVVVVIAAGVVVLLVGFPVPQTLRTVSLASLAAFGAIGVTLAWLVWRRPNLVTDVLGSLGRRGVPTPRLVRWTERLRAVEDRILGYAARHPRRTARMAMLHLVFHAAAIAEVYVVLWFVADGGPPTVLIAFVLESVNRLVTVAFKFVPLRLGVDEAASGFVSDVLLLGGAAGVTLAIVRKARVLVFAGIGVALIARRTRGGADPLPGVTGDADAA